MDKEKELKYEDNERNLMLEKLIMDELLNAKDFNILLKTLQEEFNKTFGFER